MASLPPSIFLESIEEYENQSKAETGPFFAKIENFRKTVSKESKALKQANMTQEVPTDLKLGLYGLETDETVEKSLIDFEQKLTDYNEFIEGYTIKISSIVDCAVDGVKDVVKKADLGATLEMEENGSRGGFGGDLRGGEALSNAEDSVTEAGGGSKSIMSYFGRKLKSTQNGVFEMVGDEEMNTKRSNGVIDMREGGSRPRSFKNSPKTVTESKATKMDIEPNPVEMSQKSSSVPLIPSPRTQLTQQGSIIYPETQKIDQTPNPSKEPIRDQNALNSQRTGSRTSKIEKLQHLIKSKAKKSTQRGSMDFAFSSSSEDSDSDEGFMKEEFVADPASELKQAAARSSNKGRKVKKSSNGWNLKKKRKRVKTGSRGAKGVKKKAGLMGFFD